MKFDMTIDQGLLAREASPPTDTTHDQPRCLRCGGGMQAGFLVEQQQSFEPAAATYWHAGSVDASHWAGVQVEPARQRAIVARRCERCAGIELFAP